MDDARAKSDRDSNSNEYWLATRQDGGLLIQGKMAAEPPRREWRASPACHRGGPAPAAVSESARRGLRRLGEVLPDLLAAWSELEAAERAGGGPREQASMAASPHSLSEGGEPPSRQRPRDASGGEPH